MIPKETRFICVIIGCLLSLGLAGQTLDFERDSLLADLPYPNLLNILPARVPGLQVSPVNCAEGDMSATLTLQGMNQVPGSKSKNNLQRNAPLIVVDGLIWYGSISDINTVDVARVEVLRDASALYGFRARNGAILITTRQGNTSKPTVRLRTAADVSDWSRRPEGTNRTWTDIISRRGVGQQYDLSVSGATRRLRYHVSGAFSRKEGILRGDDYREAAVLARLEYHPLEWLQLSVKGACTNAAQWGQTPRIQNAFWMGEDAREYCTIPGYESWPNLKPDGKTVNPLIGEGSDASTVYTDRHRRRNDYHASACFQIRFPFLEGLSFRTSYQLLGSRDGEDVSNDPRLFVNTNDPDSMDHPERFASFTTTSIRRGSADYGDWESVLRYARGFGSHHLALYAAYGREEEKAASREERYVLSNVDDPSRYESRRHYGYSDICAGFSYSFRETFFARLSCRRDQVTWLDGLSEEGDRQTIHKGYYQMALAWAPLTDRLRLHASFGAAPFHPADEISLSFVRKSCIGLDFSLFDKRLSGTVEGYAHQSHYLSQSFVWGTALFPAKDCSVSNKGVEVSLHSLNMAGGGARPFRWESDLSLALNRNRIVRLNGETEMADISSAVAYGYDNYYAAVTGYPISGIFEYDASRQEPRSLGDGDPLLTLNLGNSLRWQKVSLYFNLRWMYGGSDHFLGYDSVNERWVSRNFLKLSDLVFSYDLIRHLRVYLSGANLVTLTRWPALDPENGGTICPSAFSNRFVSMPAFRTLRLGLCLRF